MKRFKCIFIILCGLLLSQESTAQLRSVMIDHNGSRVHYGVMIKGVGEVIVDTYGKIVRVLPHDDHHQDDIRYEYYSDFRNYEAGKIKSIGDITFTYHSDFRSYEAGKVKSIGGVAMNYYSDFRDYEAGKLKSVAGVSIDYYSDFRDYEAGKLKSIGRHKYEYFSNFGAGNNAGQPKSGYARVEANGIIFRVGRY